MVWGASIKGGSSNVQIDTNYQNHQLVTSGVIATNAAWIQGGGGGAFVYIDLPFTGRVAPMLAISCEGTPITHYEVVASGGSFTYRISKSMGVSGTYDAPVYYWLFDAAPAGQAATGGRYNMIIRDPTTSKIIFDAALKPLRIVDFLLSKPNTTTNYTYSAGQYATIPCRIGQVGSTQFIGVGSNLDRYELITSAGMRKIANGTQVGQLLTYMQFFLSGAPSPWPNYNSDVSDWLVVDVTNY